MNANKCVVNVKTESYQRGKSYFYGRTIRVLERLTTYNQLKEEVDMVGTFEALGGIINLDSVEDGVYNLVCVNKTYDWESGNIDSCDLKLVPYENNV